jgi:hypothetical protein
MTQTPTLCLSCGKPREGLYCAGCGEKRLGAADHTVRQFIGHAVKTLTNADGKLLLTLRTLLRHPGLLTADHLRGRRKPYIAPLQLFLIANLVFFLLHPVLGSNTLTTALNTHLHYTWHHQIAESMVTPRLAQRAMSVDAYAAIFNPASVTQAKSFVILVVPMFSLAVVALYWRHRRKYIAPLIFSAHFCAAWLLLICATLALTNLVVRLLRSADIFPSADQVGGAILVFTTVIMSVHLFHAVRTVFNAQPAWLSAINALVLALAFDLSLELYRFALFFITFWST